MKFLVDANVLSEPTKPRPDEAVVQWLRDHESDLAISSIVRGELQYGILSLPSGKRRTRLDGWFAAGVSRLPTLVFDANSATSWARLLAKLRRAGKAMPIKDSLIAAVAIQHRLVVVTRNVADFRSAGVKVVDPFSK